ncbi:MAG: AAA family ATPase [Campylobacteraceae bacterium]|jgi:ATP-dependent metalloprotease FtsH|nr:AAA family ATPase [Campylobacteraceae bacterium]
MEFFKMGKLQIVVMSFSVLVLLSLYISYKNSPKPIDLDRYDNLLQTKQIESVKIYENELIIYTKKDIFSIYKDVVDLNELAKSNPIKVTESFSAKLLPILLLFAILAIIFIYIRGSRRNSFSLEEERKKIFENANIAIESSDFTSSSKITPSVSNVKFENVAGIEEVKEELSEIVDFLKNPSKYRKLNIKLPRGVLLVGPPGVGKTFVAKAVAGEANVLFFYQSGASFVQIYVGMGAKKVRELFSYAKSNAPSIIFIDEIDAVGKARGGLRNDEREATLNQLLTEMDGFDDNSGVIVIGATNKIDMIDEALLRSQRFDRRIFVSLPDFHDRVKILEEYLRDKNHKVDVESIAKITVGFSGAAISTLVNEAAINVLRRGAKSIEFEDFLAVRDKVILGKKRLVIFNEREKNIQATYQAAKALCAYWFEVDFDKISLIGDFTKDYDKELESRTELVSKLKVLLAGVAISKIKFSESFSNNSEDIFKAREIAREMVEKYAMGEKLIPFTNDIEAILKSAFDEIAVFLEGMQKPLEEIVQILLKEETISKAKIKEIMREAF